MQHKQGRLFFVIGPSGAGKDALLNYARERVKGVPGIVFAHRYITRPADAGGENHIALSCDEFTARLERGLFAMHWDGHGHRYGIGCEIDEWLGKGLDVVVNGSRAYLPVARQRYPHLLPVLIEVSEKVLLKRLLSRGRERAEEIAARLNRSRLLDDQVVLPPETCVIHNDGSLREAGRRFIDLLAQDRFSACG